MKKRKYIPAILAVIISIMLILSGCSNSGVSNAAGSTANTENNTVSVTGTSLALDTSDMFTDRDNETQFDESTATKIEISDSNNEINITKAGVYILSGSTSDGSITVSVPDTEKAQIVLNGVSVTSKTSAALCVKSGDKVFITTVKGTDNTLSNGGSFTDSSDNIDGAVFSKTDITFNGEGTLNITSLAGHGIVGKDDVKFTGGTYVIRCASHAVDANDSIRIANAAFAIAAGKDGLHSDNSEDSEKGYIYIQSGTVNINANDDAIHAITTLQIDDGTLNLNAAEGLEATLVVINGGTISIEASDDGINAAQKTSGITPIVEINGGSITIVMGQGDTDGVDSNGDIIINGGTLDVTGNSTFDYDGTGVINGGTVIVNGTKVTTLPNQFMGGGMGGRPGGINNGSHG